jgi:hypothetical protein
MRVQFDCNQEEVELWDIMVCSVGCGIADIDVVTGRKNLTYWCSLLALRRGVGICEVQGCWSVVIVVIPGGCVMIGVRSHHQCFCAYPNRQSQSWW